MVSIGKRVHRIARRFYHRKTKKPRKGRTNDLFFRFRNFLRRFKRPGHGYHPHSSGKSVFKVKKNKAGLFRKIITKGGRRYHHKGRFISAKDYKNYKRNINTQGEEIF